MVSLRGMMASPRGLQNVPKVWNMGEMSAGGIMGSLWDNGAPRGSSDRPQRAEWASPRGITGSPGQFVSPKDGMGVVPWNNEVPKAFGASKVS